MLNDAMTQLNCWYNRNRISIGVCD